MTPLPRAAIWLLAALWLQAPIAQAEPFVAPGDILLRHDIELLSDAGVLSTPITSWPLSWGDIHTELAEVDAALVITPGLTAAITRLRQRAGRETSWGSVATNFRIAGAKNRRDLRNFEDTPRANAEASASVQYTGLNTAMRLELTQTGNSEDGQSVQFDGSYFAWLLGNTSVSLGYQDQWWGPGWDGSLALSNNARPTPGLRVARNFSTRPKSKWLRWIGPWTASAFFTRLDSDRVIESPYLLGGRLAFRPLSSLEIGITRTAQWGGAGRPENLDSLFDLLIGRDNAGDDGLSAADEPGNQMAGYDWRWTMWRGRVPAVFYGQLIGEDEAGGLPSRFLGLIGVSAVGTLPGRTDTLRVRLEYSDTTCQFYEASKIFDCAYQSSVYPSGYRYRGRSVGHSTDADSRQVLLGATWRGVGGQGVSAMLRKVDVNRGTRTDLPHQISAQPSEIDNIEVTYYRELFDGLVEIGVGVDRVSILDQDSDTETRAFVQWRTNR
ncbi:MAG: capsule assembly Wzi family protein [Gammaproteobacteria bacterium]